MRYLVWFRTDLRVHDHEALTRACRDATRGVIGVFLVSPGEWSAHDWSPAKVDLVLRSVRDLEESLARLNIPLLVRTAEQPAEIPGLLLSLAREHSCDVLACTREYEVNESQRDAAVESAFRADGREVWWSDDQVLAPPGTIVTGEGRFYTVFTPFQRALYDHLQRQGVPGPKGVPPRQEAPAAPLRQPWRIPPGVLDPWKNAPEQTPWPAGEAWARRRLREFLQRDVAAYERRRDYPAEAGTSRLSPYLAIGSISARECLWSALELAGGRLQAGPPGVSKWIGELAWREFYIHITSGFPRVCMHRALRPRMERIPWSRNPEHLEAWKTGRTGIPIVDAGMRELASTGWMHNRARMITAMFLSKNLLLDWRLGERHFMRHLVDGFLASNNGGWQWSAGTGADAAPYFRIFNPVRQGQRFDPRGEYVRRFVPELAGAEGDAVHQPWRLPPLARSRLEYPPPIVDLAQSRLRAIRVFEGLGG